MVGGGLRKSLHSSEHTETMSPATIEIQTSRLAFIIEAPHLGQMQSSFIPVASGGDHRHPVHIRSVLPQRDCQTGYSKTRGWLDSLHIVSAT